MLPTDLSIALQCPIDLTRVIATEQEWHSLCDYIALNAPQTSAFIKPMYNLETGDTGETINSFSIAFNHVQHILDVEQLSNEATTLEIDNPERTGKYARKREAVSQAKLAIKEARNNKKKAITQVTHQWDEYILSLSRELETIKGKPAGEF